MALLDLSYQSRVMGRHCLLRAIVPQTPPPDTGWRVLYLLHGGGDDHTVWTRQTSIERYVQRRNVVVVMPDGGGGRMSFYTDMKHGGMYFTQISEELPTVLGNMLPISARREDTFVGGLSMGGYGAARFALMRPEQYGGAIIMSAGNMIDHLDIGPMRGLSDPRTLRMMKDSFGEDFPHQKGTHYDLLFLAQQIVDKGLPAPRLYHTIGSQDNGYLQTMSMREYFGSLNPNPFHYHFVEHPGIHTWEFWDAYIREGMDYMGLTEV